MTPAGAASVKPAGRITRAKRAHHARGGRPVSGARPPLQIQFNHL